MAKTRAASKKLEWVEARTNGYERLKRFYGSVLGLPLVFEEERKDFLQFRVGSSKTYLALLDSKKTGMPGRGGFVPTFEVADLDRFVEQMKRKRVRVGKEIAEGDHVRLVDFYDPDGNLLQAFQWKKRPH
jgi:predicted enzyme related to lactoylglutathione lyase